MHADLLKVAGVDAAGSTPARCDLRRAVSTVYYAMFHHVSDICSNLLVGDGSSGLRRARLQVYRSLDHKQVLDACQKAKIPDTDFPKPIADYSALFLNAYKSRCKADYDPTSDGDFNLPQALHKIGEAEEAIRRFESAELGHRRAFAVLVAVKRPKGDRA